MSDQTPPELPEETDYDTELLMFAVDVRQCGCLDGPEPRLCDRCDRAYELLRRFQSTLTARCESLEQEKENLRTFWLSESKYFRDLVAACEPFLKGEESPAECIERWRNDGLTLMKLLADEKFRCEALETEKHGAYAERNRLVAVLSRLWPAHTADHPADDLTWDDEWRTIVCIHSPVGQLTWHIKDSERSLFAHLQHSGGHWDGHTTEQKYARLTEVRPSDAELRCEALTAERDRHQEALIEQRVIGHGEGQQHTIDDVNAGRIDDLIAPRLARCQHLEQAVRDISLQYDNDFNSPQLTADKMVETARAALASLLPSQYETPGTDENRVSFAAGYTAALDDALKGKTHD